MPPVLYQFLCRIGVRLRGAVAWLLAGLSVNRDLREVDARLAACSLGEQVALVGGVLAALALATVLFSFAGPGGVAAFWGALAFVIR